MFVSACKDHVAAIKAEDKAKTEMVAARVDIFFGFAAPVFASYILGAGGGGITRKLAEGLMNKKAAEIQMESGFISVRRGRR
jgi:hypothetical protein